eukprot:7940372-Pyramimonas_sp.AAC.1
MERNVIRIDHHDEVIQGHAQPEGGKELTPADPCKGRVSLETALSVRCQTVRKARVNTTDRFRCAPATSNSASSPSSAVRLWR